MTTRMLTSTFGTTYLDTGRVAAGLPTSPSITVDYLPSTNVYGIKAYDDKFYEFSAGVNQIGGTYITYDQHDLRDFLKEGKAMKNAMVNIQRMKETPLVIECFNIPPRLGIFETIIITNASLAMDTGDLGANWNKLFSAGFDSSFPVNGNNHGKLDDQREILYCERRLYMQDRSQEYSSPDAMGSMFGGPRIGTSETRWTSQFFLTDRTVCGQADMVIGPDLQIIRMISVDIVDRSAQNTTSTAPPEPAREYLDQQFRVYIGMPALNVNVIGDVEELTATQKATEYTNVFLSNQNLP